MGCAREGEFWFCGEDVIPCACGAWSLFLCDFPMGKGKTCDAPLCEHCAIEMTPPLPISTAKRGRRKVALEDLHLCPAHYAIAGGEKNDP